MKVRITQTEAVLVTLKLIKQRIKLIEKEIKTIDWKKCPDGTDIEQMAILQEQLMSLTVTFEYFGGSYK